MTVSSEVSRVEYAGNGATVTFAVPFYFINNADLKIVQIDVLGGETVLSGTITGAGNPSGGSVLLAIAPPSGSTLAIYRDPPMTQTTSYGAGRFPAASHERALDRQVMISQRLSDRIIELGETIDTALVDITTDAIAALDAATAERIEILQAVVAPPAYIVRPEEVFADGVTGIWLWGWDSSQMRVNSDGTGGQPLANGYVGRWLDKSGNGNHLSQLTSNIRPVYRGGQGLVTYNATNGTARVSWLTNNALATNLERTDASGGMIVSIPGGDTSSIFDLGNSNFGFFVGRANIASYAYLNIFYETAPNYIETTLPWTSRKMLLLWRANATELTLRMNGVQQVIPMPLGAQVMSEFHLSHFDGGAPKPIIFHEVVTFNGDIGQGRLLGLENYLTLQAGPRPDPNKTVHIVGDSLSSGVGSEVGKPWHEYCSNRSTSTWTSLSKAGGFLASPSVNASTVASLKGSTEGVVINYTGTNDIASGFKTGAQAEAFLAGYLGTLKAAGQKVIVCTLQHFAANNAERIIFNNLLKANYLNYADDIVKLDEDSRLDDATDLGFFTDDGVHFNDAGHASVGSLVNTALVALA